MPMTDYVTKKMYVIYLNSSKIRLTAQKIHFWLIPPINSISFCMFFKKKKKDKKLIKVFIIFSIELIKQTNKKIAGANAVVLGRSKIVGTPGKKKMIRCKNSLFINNFLTSSYFGQSPSCSNGMMLQWPYVTLKLRIWVILWVFWSCLLNTMINKWKKYFLFIKDSSCWYFGCWYWTSWNGKRNMD